MFTLIRNYRAVFMMSVANGLEGDLGNFDTDRDGDLSAQEARNLLSEQAEAKSALELTEVETLEAATELAENIDTTDGLDRMEQKTIQYLASKILKLTGQEVKDGSIDGDIGTNSLKDISLAIGTTISSKDEISGNIISNLRQTATELVTSKKSELAQAEAAAEALEVAEQEGAQAIIAQYPTIVDIKALPRRSEEAKTVQTALNTLGYNVGTVDGIIGAKTETAYKLYEISLAEANKSPEELQVQESLEQAKTAIEAMKKENGRKGIKAIQQAYIDAGYDLGGSGADGKPGTKTMAAVEDNPSIALSAIASHIDTTDDAQVSKRLVSEKPAGADAIDTALTNMMNSGGDIQALAAEFTNPELGSGVRNENAQYISLWLQANGHENSSRAGEIMEAIMAEGKGHYEQNTVELQVREAIEDAKARFARNLGKFEENLSGSYYRIQQTLQSQSGRSRVENGMESGISGTATELLLAHFGVSGEHIATRAHFLTGQGKDGDVDTSIEMANGIQLSNGYYDEQSGAIYAVVAKGNGCEGNLVVIPVETFIKPKPKPVVVPRTVVVPGSPKTTTTTEPVVPATTPEYPSLGLRDYWKCEDGEVQGYIDIHQGDYDGDGEWDKGEYITIPDTNYPRNGNSCGPRGNKTIVQSNVDLGAVVTPVVRPKVDVSLDEE